MEESKFQKLIILFRNNYGPLPHHLLFIVLFIVSVIPFSLPAQAQPVGFWKVYPAYTVSTYSLSVGHRIYSIMEDKLMAYDTEDGSITTFDWTQQLSDVTVKYIHYSASAKRLIIIYDNGNIDLLSTEDDFDVINLAQLKNSTNSKKTVNNVQVSGNNAYICTDFGIVVVDMNAGLILDSYEINLSVWSCALNDKKIFAGTKEGLWYADLTKNLKDKSNWTKFNDNYTAQHMEYFDDCFWVQVYGYLFVSNPEGTSFKTLVSNLKPNFSYVTLSDNQLILGSSNDLYIFSDKNTRKHFKGTYSWNSLLYKNNLYWASDGYQGLQAYKIDDEGNTAVSIANIHPNSPLHNYSLHLSIAGNRLLVSGGNWNYASTSLPGTAMILESDGTWTNFDPQSVATACPTEQYIDVTQVIQDPKDPTHHFAGTARNGIFEFRNAKCVKHIGLENSSLQSILPTDLYKQRYVSADGLTYDSDGNIWMLNCTEGKQDTAIRIWKTDGTWTGIPCRVVHDAPTMDKIFFDSRGWAWINSRRMTQRGILMLNYNGTIERSSDDRFLLRSTIVNQDGNSYSPENFFDITEDKDGNIWIGTELGPFLISEPENYRSDSFTFEQVKVSRNDGSGLADYLLTGIPILSIAVDGAGRKWFGTMTNGVYLVSEDCQEQLAHFTTENSPLPSNEVFDITIHPESGKVFFATGKGLCSYKGDATEAEEELQKDNIYAFPNPVTPDYNGPITLRSLVRNSEVKIVSPTGQVVASGTSNGGTFTWNGHDSSGRRVASGIYTAIINTPDGDQATTTRITVIR